jgi:hypothetical protein
MGADEFVGQAKIILRWIEQNTAESFSKRDLHQALRGTFKRVEELERPLALLASHGFIRKRDEGSGGPGRPPSPIYDVNPLWASQSAKRIHPQEVSGYCEDSENCESRTIPGGQSSGSTVCWVAERAENMGLE